MLTTVKWNTIHQHLKYYFVEENNQFFAQTLCPHTTAVSSKHDPLMAKTAQKNRDTQLTSTKTQGLCFISLHMVSMQLCMYYTVHLHMTV